MRNILHILLYPFHPSVSTSQDSQPVSHNWWHVVIKLTLNPSCLRGRATSTVSGVQPCVPCFLIEWCFHFEYLCCDNTIKCDPSNEGVSTYLWQESSKKVLLISLLVCTNCRKHTCNQFLMNRCYLQVLSCKNWGGKAPKHVHISSFLVFIRKLSWISCSGFTIKALQ